MMPASQRLMDKMQSARARLPCGKLRNGCFCGTLAEIAILVVENLKFQAFDPSI